MCGIAGFVGPGDRDDVTAMTRALAHRGPDGEGFHVDGGERVFLGHRRLAILDLDGGAQPMWNEDRTIGVVYNGEIYNHLELRQELVAAGHRFNTDHCDTEVLVHGYEEWGTALAERLNGMFAFAVYDAPRRRLLLARDRFGEKPLFYCRRPGLFAFASEADALFHHSRIACEIDPRSLQKYFAYGYVPGPRSLYRTIDKLPGGCQLVCSLAELSVDVRRYWQFRIEPDESLERAEDGPLAEELAELLSQAVRRRLISDVPLGLFLSGGIDSSSTLALMARHRPPASIESFTIGFKEPSYDESGEARRVAAHFGTAHREEILEIDGARRLIATILPQLDEPLCDPSILPTYLLSRFTRRHVTVALSGDGGDELFAGYDPFLALGPASLYLRLVPAGLHRGLRQLAQLLPRSPRNMSLDFKLRRTLMGLSHPPELWNPVWLSPAEPQLIRDIFDEPLSAEELYEEAIAFWGGSQGKSALDRSLEFYTQFYLQDGILVKSDRAAMLNSLESRAVFLDNDVADFCMRLPARFKLRGRTRKYLLKKAMQRLLPADVLRRRKKGFGIPIAGWLRSLEPAAAADDALGRAGLRQEVIRRCWAEHRAGAADHRLLLWSHLSLEASQSRHIQGDNVTMGKVDRSIATAAAG